MLGIQNQGDITKRLDKDEVDLIYIIDGKGSRQKALHVNEPGLYALIMRSRKREARAFDRWVRHDVLPQIRITGSYHGQGMTKLLAEQSAQVEQLQGQVLQLASAFTATQAQIDRIATYVGSWWKARQPTAATRRALLGTVLERYEGRCPIHHKESADSPIPVIITQERGPAQDACLLHWKGIHTARVHEMVFCCFDCWKALHDNQPARVARMTGFILFQENRLAYQDAHSQQLPLNFDTINPDDILGTKKGK